MDNILDEQEMAGVERGKLAHLAPTFRSLAKAAAEAGAGSVEAKMSSFGGNGHEPSGEEYVPYVIVGVRLPGEDS